MKDHKLRKVIARLNGMITEEKAWIESGKKSLDEATDIEAIEIIQRAIRGHRIALITLEKVLKEVSTY